jgi:hypothetical protein
MVAPNTKERSDAIQAAARALLVEREIDIKQQVLFRPLAQELVKRADCHYDTAKRHIAKAVRRARGEMAAQWGGAREGAGRPKEDGEL